MGVSSRAVARALGVTAPAVLKAYRDGRIGRLADGTYDLEAVRQQWMLNTDLSNGRNAVTGHPKGVLGGASSNGNDVANMGRARSVYETFRAALVQLEYERRKGELVRLEDVKKSAFEEGRRLRDRILAIPDRVAAVIAGMDDPSDVHRALSDELLAALSELSA